MPKLQEHSKALNRSDIYLKSGENRGKTQQTVKWDRILGGKIREIQLNSGPNSTEGLFQKKWEI